MNFLRFLYMMPKGITNSELLNGFSLARFSRNVLSTRQLQQVPNWALMEHGQLEYKTVGKTQDFVRSLQKIKNAPPQTIDALTNQKQNQLTTVVRTNRSANVINPSHSFFNRTMCYNPFSNPGFRMHSSMSNSVRYFSSYNQTSKGTYSGYNGGGGFNFLLQAFGASIMLGMLGTLGYVIYKAHVEPRERKVMGTIINDEMWQQEYSLSDFQKSSNGSLSNRQIELNDKIWLKKGAKGVSELVKEFVIGTALHELDPQVQPETLIFVEPEQAGASRGRFFTLSEMKPNSMDLQDFITQSDWREKLSQKPMQGLDVALAKVGLMAGQQDCKYANLIITDFGTHYEVAAIDFELSGERFFSINSRIVTTNLGRLAGFVRDLHSADSPFGEFKLGLSGDPRGSEFMAYALEHSMCEDNILEFYRQVANTDFISPTISRLRELSERSDIVSSKDVEAWDSELRAWQTAAQEFMARYDNSHRKSYN